MLAYVTAVLPERKSQWRDALFFNRFFHIFCEGGCDTEHWQVYVFIWLQVSAVYSITWFPVLIIYMLNYYLESQEYGNITYIIAIVIATFNSCVNPFVYVFVNERFRSHIKRLFELPFQKQNRVQLEQRMTQERGESSSQQQRQALEITDGN